MNTTSHLIRTFRRPYEVWVEDPSIQLALDRTEPPIPYRTAPRIFADTCSRYPLAHTLEAMLALRFEIDAKNVMVTAGADEAIDRACRALLANGDELLTTTPTFEMIGKYGALAGAGIVATPWLDREFSISNLTQCVSPKTRLIVLISPNNPTGQVLRADAIERIAQQYSKIVLLVDLAYVEFAESDPSSQLLRLPNILLVRSFSKAWGLPGLRLGYAMGHPEVIDAMRAAGGPYSVAARSIEIIFANLDRFEIEMRKYVEQIRAERDALEEWMRVRSLNFIPSQSNFILLFPREADAFDRTLRSFGIRARSFGPSSGIEAARRLTLPGNTNAFALLQRALNETLNAS